VSGIQAAEGAEIIRPTLQLLVSIITVGAGGLLASYLWRRIVRPELKILDGKSSIRPSEPNSNTRVHRIEVKNTGHRAAKNCKPEFEITSISEENMFHVSSVAQWAEENKPTRVTINVGETAAFEVIEFNESDKTVSFPAGDGRDMAPIYEYSTGQADNTTSPDHVNIAVSPDKLLNSSSNTDFVRVTAENAASVKKGIKLGGDTEDITISVG
jgi:hypothetical protein